ncbi:MAG: amylo-alpha-1,6-glucosidase [Elusimicrobiota bacterium]
MSSAPRASSLPAGASEGVIALGRDVCGDIAAAAEREWLETNGRGGYAMGTVCGGNSRRYHGLLTVALRPPVDRFQVLNRLEESLVAGGASHEISCQAYPGTVYPQGYRYLESFRLDPFPVWTFAVAGGRLEKTFFLRYGEDTAVVVYELLSGPEIRLKVRPLITCRNHHHLIREDARFHGRVESASRRLKITAPGAPPVYFASREAAFSAESFWYRNQEYSWEQRRGLDHREDVYSPGVFEVRLKAGQAAALVASTREMDPSGAVSWRRLERVLRGQLLEKSPVRGPAADRLVLAADQFLVSREKGVSVIAGYPWFEDWGRDAMISLPGLCLAAGRPKEAGELLDVFAGHVRGGLLPNRFPEDHPSPDYNAVDAPLWLVWAAQKYFQTTQDADRLRRLVPVLRDIVDAYEKGKPLGVHMDDDGLVSVPPSAGAFTWMDVRLDGGPATPRSGKPVELQALWYNALQFLAELDLKLGGPSRGYEKLAAVARNSFNEKFWNEPAQYLFDRIEGKERDAALRPNALFAVSLPYEILEQGRFRAVVDTAERELLVPLGVRSLAASHPSYRGRYGGPPAARDAAYHQGSAWPWLLGAFLTAYVKAHGSSEETKAKVKFLLLPVAEHLRSSGLGGVSEILEGDAPHSPHGCPFQAWSTAEILRVMWEENISL